MKIRPTKIFKCSVIFFSLFAVAQLGSLGPTCKNAEFSKAAVGDRVSCVLKVQSLRNYVVWTIGN